MSDIEQEEYKEEQPFDDDYDYNDYNEDEYYEEEYKEGDNEIKNDKSKFGVKFIESYNIKQIIDQKVHSLMDLLQLPYDEILILFKHFKWNKDNLTRAFIEGDDIEKIRTEAGLFSTYSQQQQLIIKEDLCQCCFDQKSEDGLTGKEVLCKNCWTMYIEHKILAKSGATPFFPSPFSDSKLTIPQTYILKYLPKEYEKKYYNLLGRNYCHESKTMKWCPAPGCDWACENANFSGQYVTCKCGNTFCFSCGKENHRPCDCSLVEKWDEKNASDSANLDWMRLNTKPCPKCRKRIEKNQGCNHMNCRKDSGGCGFDFCWMCMGDWKEHGSQTGGYYQCNKYNSTDPSSIAKDKNQKDKEKSDLDKYIFYFERFNHNSKSMDTAKKNIEKLSKVVQDFHDKCGYDNTFLQFLGEANEVLIKCRLALKWTYCYGFHITNEAEKNLFEQHQAKLEQNSEQLADYLDSRFEDYLQVERMSDFNKFRQDVINYKELSERFRSRVIDAIEVGLMNEQNYMDKS